MKKNPKANMVRGLFFLTRSLCQLRVKVVCKIGGSKMNRSPCLNSPLLTFRSPPGTLARNLLEMNDSNRTMQLFVKRRVRLEGAELQEFQKKEKQDTQKVKKSE